MSNHRISQVVGSINPPSRNFGKPDKTTIGSIARRLSVYMRLNAAGVSLLALLTGPRPPPGAPRHAPVTCGGPDHSSFDPLDLQLRQRDLPHVQPLDAEGFLEACEAAPVTVILFHGEHCRSCRAFEPKYARLAQEYADRAKFFKVVAARNLELCSKEEVLTLLPCLNVYVGGCCIKRLSSSEAGSIKALAAELDQVLEPLTPNALLEQDGDSVCDVPAEAEEDDEVAGGFLALLCSVGLLSRVAAVLDGGLEIAAVVDGLELTEITATIP